jgi:N-acetylmuramoyl-L-alanine amidase
VAKREVNLRKGPATTEEVLAKITPGTTLSASVVRGDWVKVTHEGTAGWVHRSLLQ